MDFQFLGKLIKITHFFSEIYRQGVHIFPENPELCTSLGLLYLQTGAHAAAFEQLGNAMAFDPNNSKAVLAAGSVGKLYSLNGYFPNKRTFLRAFLIEKL